MNKKKIVNDPVYGFITIPNELIYDIIQHPYFQRLRRIKQLGLTEYVYPGALHTRFQHALGAMHLMTKALDTLRQKGHLILDAEYEAAQIAILLHDIGHGPFSHTLEFSLFDGVDHEKITGWTLEKLNQDFEGKLSMAIQIFEGSYPRKFLTQLVSSQLDTDRLDYLNRDRFFTGVQEGTIGAERIIKMLDVKNDELVVEEKGIYSIESFLSARRIMYWQVYLHKTSISAENMLIQLISQAKRLRQSGVEVPATPAFSIFLERNITAEEFAEDPDLLGVFMLLDDTDIWGSIKFWMNHPDKVLQLLSKMLLNRNLFQVKLLNEPSEPSTRTLIKDEIMRVYQFSAEEADSFYSFGTVSNEAYVSTNSSINILKKDGTLIDVALAGDLPNIKAISKIVQKHYLCWPKNVNLHD
ncbi:MAG: HD superfamily phosphohydrolase [Cyclobacteriaceae bacterium]